MIHERPKSGLALLALALRTVFRPLNVPQPRSDVHEKRNQARKAEDRESQQEIRGALRRDEKISRNCRYRQQDDGRQHRWCASG